MKTQSYSNHERRDWGWLIAFLILLGWTIVSVADLVDSLLNADIQYLKDSAGMMLLSVGLLAFVWIVLFKLRGYATKLQDRIIRQEVNFRHYVATGKELNPALTIKQIVALRFAGDAEFVALCEKAVAEDLSNKQIKQAIVDWKGDYLRV